jgi:hypothetical protein
MTVLASHEVVDDRVFEHGRVKGMAFFARKGAEITVLVMAGPAISCKAGMFRVIEFHRLIFVGQAVQHGDCGDFRRASRIERTCENHADTRDKQYQYSIFHIYCLLHCNSR